MDKEQYFWNATGETFAGHRFGEDVTKHFEGDQKRADEYIALGKIVTSAPVDFNDAKQSELNVLRKTVETQKVRIAELETEAKKGGTAKPSKKVKDLEGEITGLKTEAQKAKDLIGEADSKIKELESQVATLTDPKGKK